MTELNNWFRTSLKR